MPSLLGGIGNVLLDKKKDSKASNQTPGPKVGGPPTPGFVQGQTSVGDVGDVFGQTGGRPNPDRAMSAFLQEAFSLRDEVERRRIGSLQFLHRAANQANRPTLTMDAVRSLFSRGADQASFATRDRTKRFLGNAASQGAFGGGAIASVLAGEEFSRLAQNRATRRDITIAKAQSDAQDRAAHFQRQTQMAQLMNQGPSLLTADALGQIAALQEARLQSKDMIEAARLSAKATKDSGKKSMIGGIIGGVLSAI